MTARTSSSARYAQLDSLRAIAVTVVMIHHYRATSFFLSGFGATLFFVLSGFFVTKSLLRFKNEVADGKTQTGVALKDVLHPSLAEAVAATTWARWPSLSC